MNDRDALETALTGFRELARARPELWEEFLRSAPAFFGVPGLPDPERDDEARLASRRHLEWFLLERFSASLDGVPVERLFAEWLEGARGAERDLGEALLGSVAGIFEVTGIEESRGVWVQDLLGLGEYPLREPEAAGELEVRDLLVGRVFPVGDAQYRISPAAGCFRSEDLRRALHEDMRALREGRRGSLRISQAEIERMFYGGGAEPPAADPETARATARRFLADGGLDGAEADALLDGLLAQPLDGGRLAPGAGDALGAVLDQLAFETQLDLERARQLLLDAWTAAQSPSGRGDGSTPAGAATSGDGAPGAPPGATPRDARAALAAFDRGRAEGRDLEILFRDLERDLGLDAEADVAAGDAPDFPGVVGAMVDEFRWDVERRETAAAAGKHAPLQLLASYGADIGVFENLRPRDLVAFGLWLLEGRHLRDAAHARQLVESLGAFCRWSEEVHEVPLWEGFRDTHAKLADSLPRLAAVPADLWNDAGEGGELFETVTAPELRVRRASGEELDVRVPDALAAHLRPGDFLRGVLRAGGALDVWRAYPPEAGDLLRGARDAGAVTSREPRGSGPR